MDFGPGIQQTPFDAPDDPAPLAVNGESYHRQFQQRWQTRLPILANSGVPLDQVRPIFAYDLRRVQAGRQPLSDREAAMGITAALTGQQQIPEPEDTGISGYLSAPIDDLRNLVTSLPQMPGAMVREVQDLPTAAEKLSLALAQPTIGEKAQAIGQVPGVRMIPGVFTATNLAQGPEGWSTIAKHPFTTALDVLPAASELGLVSKAGEALAPAAARFDRWSAEKGFGGKFARGTASMLSKVGRQASVEFGPVNDLIDKIGDGTSMDDRIMATEALQHMRNVGPESGVTLSMDQAARLNSVFGDAEAGYLPFEAGTYHGENIPEVPEAAQGLADYQRNVMNPETEAKLVDSGQAQRLEDIPHVSSTIEDALGPEYGGEILATDERQLKNLMNRSKAMDNLAGRLTQVEGQYQHHLDRATEAQKAWNERLADHEFAGFDTDTDALIGNLRETLSDWINRATPIMDAEARSTGLTEFVAHERPWPKNVPRLRPAEEAFLSGGVTPGRVESEMYVQRAAKARPNPKLAPDEHVIRRERMAYPPAGGPVVIGYEQYSGKLLRLQEEVTRLTRERDAAMAPVEKVKADPRYLNLTEKWNPDTGKGGVLSRLEHEIAAQSPNRVLQDINTRAKAAGVDFGPRSVDELVAYREHLARQQAELNAQRAALQRDIDASGGTLTEDLRDRTMRLKRLQEATEAGTKTFNDAVAELEAARERQAALIEQRTKIETENPLLQQVRRHEEVVASRFGKPLEEAEAALEAERQRVAKARPDMIEAKEKVDPREHRLTEVYQALDDADAGRRPLDDGQRQALEAEAARLESEGVVVPPSDRKVALAQREPRIEQVGQKRYDAREKLYYQLLGDQRGTRGLIEEAADALRGDDIPLARRKLGAARRVVAKAAETWPEFDELATEMDTALDYYQKATAKSGFPKYLREKAHWEKRIADATDTAKLYEGKVAEINDRIAKHQAAVVSTVKQAPPARYTPLMTEVLRRVLTEKAGAAEALKTLTASMAPTVRSIAEALTTTYKDVLVPREYMEAAYREIGPEGMALVDEYRRIKGIYDRPFRPADLRRIVKESYGIEHPAVGVLAEADAPTLEAIRAYKDMVVDRKWPDELTGRRNAAARSAATDQIVARIDDALGSSKGKLVRSFFDEGFDQKPGDYILPSDKGVIESVQVGAFDRMIDSADQNAFKAQINRTWTTMRDVYGFDPVFVHHVRPGAVSKMSMANLTPDRVSKPTQAKARSIFGSPYESDISVALKHQAFEWIQREWQINSLFGYHDGHIYTPGILSSATGSFGGVAGDGVSLAEASGHGRGYAYEFHELVEMHMPEINGRAQRAGLEVPPADVVDLKTWINTTDAEGYRAIASEYLNGRYSRIAPFDLMNWASGGKSSRRVGDTRAITRFGPEGSWTMDVPEEVYVPKSVNKVMESLLIEKKGPSFLYSVYDKSLDVFRVSALAFSPRFHFYNVVGGGIVSVLRTGPSLIGDLFAAKDMIGSIGDLGENLPAGMSRGSLMVPEGVTRLSEGLANPPAFVGKVDDFLQNRLGWEKGRALGGMVKTVRGWAERSFAWNEWVDNLYRSAVYLYGKRQAAARLGVSEEELMATLGRTQAGEDVALNRNWAAEDVADLPAGMAQAALQLDEIQRAGIDLSNKVLQDWDSMLPWERHVLRNVVPFYGWMRHITKYVATFPIDHPWRAAILTTYARIEDQDRQDPLGDRFQSIFWLGTPGDDGRQLTLNTAGINPFQSVGDMFTFAGFLSQLSPAFSSVLEMAGVDMTTASSQLYPEMTYDPESGRLVAVRKSPAEALAGAFIPQSEGLLGAMGFSKDMRQLAITDPEAWRSRIMVSLGVPLSPRFRSKQEEIVKAEVARNKAATNAVTRAIRTGEWAEADRYSKAVLSDSDGKPHLVEVAALKRALAARQAQAQAQGRAQPVPT